MTLLNTEFEDAGDTPGEAQHWTLASAVAGQRYAGWGPAPHRAWESFAWTPDFMVRWSPEHEVLASFDGLYEGVEDFHEGWHAAVYLTAFPSGFGMPAHFMGKAFEDFSEGFSVEVFLNDWGAVETEVGSPGGQPWEDFAQGWRNDGFMAGFHAAVSERAHFSQPDHEVENFEIRWSDLDTV